jgi:hypothetical protein
MQCYWDFIKWIATKNPLGKKEEIILAWKNVRKKMTEKEREGRLFKILDDDVKELEKTVDEKESKKLILDIRYWCSC